MHTHKVKRLLSIRSCCNTEYLDTSQALQAVLASVNDKYSDRLWNLLQKLNFCLSYGEIYLIDPQL